MRQYFDLFIYLANWGTRRFSLSLPRRLVEISDLRKSSVEHDAVTITSLPEKLVIDVCRDIEADDWDDGSGWLASLAPLRADVLNGDLRVLYLIWLMGVETGEVPDEALEPMSGIGSMTAPLDAFAEFFCIDQDLIAAAASKRETRAMDSSPAIGDYIRSLEEEEKVALLLRLHDGDDPHLGAELRRRVRAKVGSSTDTSQKRRTAMELRATASRLAAERERAAAERTQAERAREEQKRAEEKERRLAALSIRGEAAWREIESLIELRSAPGYDEAVALLTDLRDLACKQGRRDEFVRRLAEVRARHARKGRFLAGLSSAALN
jgi:hypothetical protein